MICTTCLELFASRPGAEDGFFSTELAETAWW